jgi:hypothetical protein
MNEDRIVGNPIITIGPWMNVFVTRVLVWTISCDQEPTKWCYQMEWLEL